MIRLFIIVVFIVFSGIEMTAQEDLLSLLGDDKEETVFATASFKTNRVINLHSLESTAKGVFDFKISHRFGFLNSGIKDLFGLDNAMMRIGGDYGITDRLTVGFGRSNYEKVYDGFTKYKILRQSSGKKNMPLTLAFVSDIAVVTLPFSDMLRENYFSSRLFYSFNLIVGRKFGPNFSAQLSPILVHRNLVSTLSEKNDVISIAVAARQKISKRIAINFEYVYLLPNQVDDNFTNSLSIGFDIETGGHVFQLHFTNSTSMATKGFVTETVGKWSKGDIHFGFNVSRVFTIIEPKEF